MILLISSLRHSLRHSLLLLRLPSSPRIFSAVAIVFLLGFLLFVAQIDLIREVVIKVNVGFPRQGVFRDGLEGLLHVDRFFGRSFEVWNVAFCVAPLLGTLYRDLKWGKGKVNIGQELCF